MLIYMRLRRLLLTSSAERLIHLALAAAALLAIDLRAAEVIPPKPDRYFNDYAGVVSKSAASRFNEQLAQFERETSDQVVVAVFPKMQSDSDIADHTQRVAQAWGVGQKDRRNGVVLFVFIQDRKMFIRGEYKGSGKTVAERKGSGGVFGLLPFITFIIVLIIISRLFRKLGGYGYSSRRGGPVFIPSGGGWSSGGGSGGGFSGFGSGGGSFGGGGAGSSW